MKEDKDVVFNMLKIGKIIGVTDKNVLDRLKNYSYTLNVDEFIDNYNRYSFDRDNKIEEIKSKITDAYDCEIDDIYISIDEIVDGNMCDNLNNWLDGKKSDIDFDDYDECDKSKSFEENWKELGGYEFIAEYYAIYDYDLMSIIVYIIHDATEQAIEEIEEEIEDEIEDVLDGLQNIFDENNKHLMEYAEAIVHGDEINTNKKDTAKIAKYMLSI